MHARLNVSHLACQAGQYWRDVVIVFVLAVGAAFASYQGAQAVDPVIVNENAWDAWFNSDVPRVYAEMVFRGASHWRINAHPLFPLITFPLVFILRAGLHLEPISAVRMVIAGVASLWISTLFLILRLVGCRRLDALLFSILASVSASAMFWFVIPETFSFGSLTILLALLVVAISQRRRLSQLWYVLVSALTLSFTITNWMAGIFATFVDHRWKRSLRITAMALLAVVMLWGVQKVAFPDIPYVPFATIDLKWERKYVFRKDSGGPLQAVRSFVFHSMVCPAIEVRPNDPRLFMMVTQHSSPGTASTWGTIAVGLWAALLGLGLWGVLSMRQHRHLRLVLGLTLIGQLVLHVVYGQETFLYSLHFGPLLVLLAAFGTQTRARPAALVLAGVLILSAGLNNGMQFDKVREFLHSRGSPGQQLLSEIQFIPTDR
jgi:hypothetical protein